MSWFMPEEKPCRVCEVLKTQVEFLKNENARLVLEKAAERAEYKRAMDVLLVKESLPIVGQGARNEERFDPSKMLAYMEEEVSVEKK